MRCGCAGQARQVQQTLTAVASNKGNTQVKKGNTTDRLRTVVSKGNSTNENPPHDLSLLQRLPLSREALRQLFWFHLFPLPISPPIPPKHIPQTPFYTHRHITINKCYPVFDSAGTTPPFPCQKTPSYPQPIYRFITHRNMYAKKDTIDFVRVKTPLYSPSPLPPTKIIHIFYCFKVCLSPLEAAQKMGKLRRGGGG